jgi:hypothetical protein
MSMSKTSLKTVPASSPQSTEFFSPVGCKILVGLFAALEVVLSMIAGRGPL